MADKWLKQKDYPAPQECGLYKKESRVKCGVNFFNRGNSSRRIGLDAYLVSRIAYGAKVYFSEENLKLQIYQPRDDEKLIR
jgi:hypothetical protein